MHGGGNRRGGGVGVDVVDMPRFVAPDGGNDRNVALFQQIENRLRVDAVDFADVAELGVNHLRLDEPAVHAADAHRAPAEVVQLRHQRFVDFARQHHLDDLARFLVRHAQTIDELRLLADALEHTGNFRAAAVHQHHFDPDEAHQHHVAHDIVLELLVDHGVAAVLDDDDFAVILLDIGQRLDQHLRALTVRHAVVHLHIDSSFQLR